MDLKIYKVDDPECMQSIHNSGIDGYVHTDGFLYLSKSDYRKLWDVFWEIRYPDNDLASCIVCLDDREVDELFTELDNARNDDAISYLLDGRKVELYLCCDYKSCFPAKYIKKMKDLDLINHLSTPRSKVKRGVPSWIDVVLLTTAGDWKYAKRSKGTYATDLCLCDVDALNITKKWCGMVNQLYGDLLNDETIILEYLLKRHSK